MGSCYSKKLMKATWCVCVCVLKSLTFTKGIRKLSYLYIFPGDLQLIISVQVLGESSFLLQTQISTPGNFLPLIIIKKPYHNFLHVIAYFAKVISCTEIEEH